MESKKNNLKETIIIETSAWFLVLGIVYAIYQATI